jgi:hypothetical protein
VRTLEDRTLLLLVIAVSLALAWILWPFFSAVLWATVLAIVFATHGRPGQIRFGSIIPNPPMIT